MDRRKNRKTSERPLHIVEVTSGPLFGKTHPMRFILAIGSTGTENQQTKQQRQEETHRGTQ